MRVPSLLTKLLRPACAAGMLVALFAGISRAQVTDDHPVTWKIDSLPELAAGSSVLVPLTATIAAGWHVYSLTQGPGGPTPTRISLPKGSIFTLADSIKADPPMRAFDQNFGIQVETYETRAAFGVPVQVAATAKPGADTLLIYAHYQVCNASTCLPVKLESVKRAVHVVAAKESKKSTASR